MTHSIFIQCSVKYCKDPTEVFLCNLAFCIVNGLQTMLTMMFCCKHMSVKLVAGVTHNYRVNTCLQNENDSVFCDLLPEIEQRSLFATLHFALKIEHCLLESSKQETALLYRHMHNFFLYLVLVSLFVLGCKCRVES